MPTPIEPQLPRRLADADLSPRGPVFPSPADWRDHLLYFLLPDRFSDGQESLRPLYDAAQPNQFKTADKRAWMDGGKRFQGGTLNGIRGRLPYLQGLGVTAIWIGPIWRQRADLETYHGYGIQNFLDVDPRFGTRQDLRDLVDAAHQLGMYVLLDIIYNHSGNNFFYDDDGTPRPLMPYRFSPPHAVHGWRSAAGQSAPNIAGLDDGVWPEEFQQMDFYTRAGMIGKWDPEGWENPMHPDTEFRRGDFFDLKNLELRDRAMDALVNVYRYWIALTDCDGYRIDTVKHVSFDASRHFNGGIREYAESIGKENFLLLGEVTGGAGMARNYLDVFGRNLDAALDLGGPAATLSSLVKGFAEPGGFFGQFGGHDELGSHREVGRYHVSVLDDHDMVGRSKHRFSSGNTGASRFLQVAHAVGVQMTTLGIPCIYYGTEQAFDGSRDQHDTAIEPLEPGGGMPFEDRYIRESMFGGTFGAFETEGCHFFDTAHPAYQRIGAIASIRARQDSVGLALRRGRQYPRETSFLGRPFSFPGRQELAAWSRLLYRTEVLVCLNTHGGEARGADVTVDANLHQDGSTMQVLYPAGAPSATVRVVDGRATVRVDLGPGEMAILS